MAKVMKNDCGHAARPAEWTENRKDIDNGDDFKCNTKSIVYIN